MWLGKWERVQVYYLLRFVPRAGTKMAFIVECIECSLEKKQKVEQITIIMGTFLCTISFSREQIGGFLSTGSLNVKESRLVVIPKFLCCHLKKLANEKRVVRSTPPWMKNFCRRIQSLLEIPFLLFLCKSG